MSVLVVVFAARNRIREYLDRDADENFNKLVAFEALDSLRWNTVFSFALNARLDADVLDSNASEMVFLAKSYLADEKVNELAHFDCGPWFRFGLEEVENFFEHGKVTY